LHWYDVKTTGKISASIKMFRNHSTNVIVLFSSSIYVLCVQESDKHLKGTRNWKDKITNNGRHVTLAGRHHKKFQSIQWSKKTQCIYYYKFHLTCLNSYKLKAAYISNEMESILDNASVVYLFVSRIISMINLI